MLLDPEIRKHVVLKSALYHYHHWKIYYWDKPSLLYLVLMIMSPQFIWATRHACIFYWTIYYHNKSLYPYSYSIFINIWDSTVNVFLLSKWHNRMLSNHCYYKLQNAKTKCYKICKQLWNSFSYYKGLMLQELCNGVWKNE